MDDIATKGCVFGAMLNIVTFVFMALKLFGVVNWSWWLVTSPTLLYIGCGMIVVLVGTIAGVIDMHRKGML